jgi:peptide subunit release factor RF-3
MAADMSGTHHQALVLMNLWSASLVAEELALVREACNRFDVQAFREGHLTPVGRTAP